MLRTPQPAPAPAPAAPAEAAAPQERRAAARVTAREGLRVLVIDDSTTIIAVLGKMLRQNGYEVTGAGDAEAGIVAARTLKPDLIYLDIVLPGMNGFDALRALRREDATRDTPIIMISGNVQATEQFYVKRIGADDFMKKPFGRGEVFMRIQDLVEAGRLPARAAPPPELLADDGSIAPADASDPAGRETAGASVADSGR
ncbi:MAG TPA: response regulator [Xanthomonadaceae bacterium]|nr:response regulator [Xanthomonadaceae bacterium]